MMPGQREHAERYDNWVRVQAAGAWANHPHMPRLGELGLAGAAVAIGGSTRPERQAMKPVDEDFPVTSARSGAGGSLRDHW